MVKNVKEINYTTDFILDNKKVMDFLNEEKISPDDIKEITNDIWIIKLSVIK
ncbi:MAG: hypothetical protein KGD63_11345 [Candidatus Lokiarchaeota archaeon]|nr:hypothetical protein [Candidatus Lokiarchaeota archaeon]